MPRKEVTTQPTDRDLVAGKQHSDVNVDDERDYRGFLENSSRPSRIYETTRLSGKSHLVQGDVFNTHNHFYGNQVPWHDVNSPSTDDTDATSGLYSITMFARDSRPEN